MSDRPRHFLVISTTGIGDTLMGTPALRALRESFPESQIHLLVNSQRKDLVAGNPHVDRILEYRNNPLFRALLFFKALPFYYDAVLVFHANEDIWNILRVIRYGVCYNRQNYHDKERRVFSLDVLPEHSIQKRMALVEKVGGKPSNDYRYEYSVPPRAMNWASEKLAGWGISPQDRIVGMQLGAADRFKCWPLDHFTELARRLHKTFQARIYLNASPEERDLVQEFERRYGDDGLFYDIGLNLTQSAAIIQSCSLFISPDTGPMHMAIGLQIPLIALFGPTMPEDTGPLNYYRAAVIQKPPSCEPCLTRRCADPICMRQISVEEVFAASMRLLGWRFSHSNENCNV